MIAGIYLITVNLIAMIIWCLDKHYAKTGHRRISEKALFLWALAGGSLGSLCAMHMVRHKTRHWYFRIGIPLLIVIQAALLIWIYKKIA